MKLERRECLEKLASDEVNAYFWKRVREKIATKTASVIRDGGDVDRGHVQGLEWVLGLPELIKKEGGANEQDRP
jgi:hypothetical protein